MGMFTKHDMGISLPAKGKTINATGLKMEDLITFTLW
jgi:hypothetical protein